MALGLADIRAEVAAFAASFDPSLVAPTDAERLRGEAAAIENIAATVKALAALRASQGGSWRREGARSPAHELARRTGTSVAKAKETLDTAEKLAQLPALDAAARQGEVSACQAAPIADAANADPSAEQRLIDKAKRASLGELKDECARTKAAAEPDDEARHAAIHRSRFLRQRRCADGAAELQYRSTVDEVAEILSVVRGYANTEFDVAGLEGRRETAEAYLADGLLAACRVAGGAATGGSRHSGHMSAPRGDSNKPRSTTVAGTGKSAAEGAPGLLRRTDLDVRDGQALAATSAAQHAGTARSPGADARNRRIRKATPTKVVVRIDWDALLRGFPVDGEVSEIAGVGPVPVSVVRAMMASGDAFLAGVVTKGVDVANVFHLGRRPSAHQETALDWLSPTCATLGCNGSVRLETDHRVDWAKTKVTLLRWLERHCDHCHDNKTRRGWALVDGHGKRPMVPPEDPRHPRHHTVEALDSS